MNEIETQIIHVLGQSEDGMDVPTVRSTIIEEYGIEYPSKRIRNKLNTLCSHSYIDKESRRLEGTRGDGRTFYTLRADTIKDGYL